MSNPTVLERLNARRDAADAAQRRGADPRASAWVSANAGSGKTHVLTRRVIRLLLAGTQPARVLCLTYTKAAAANMQNRVFGELGQWVALDDHQLADAIEAMEGERPGAARLKAARRLFARAVETPGGLKIQTIHAFCERLLQLFPFEADVPARFEVAGEREADALLAHALDAVTARALAEPDTRLGYALTRLAREVTAEGFRDLVREALKHRGALAEEAGHQLEALEAAAERHASALREGLGLAAHHGVETIEHEMAFGGLGADEWRALAEAFADAGTKTERAWAEGARAALTANTVAAWLDLLGAGFLTAKGKRLKAITTKAARKAHPALCERLDAECERYLSLLALRRAAQAAERTEALMAVADAVMGGYADEKRRRGLLDFPDLVARARRLLDRGDASAWVLFKLDQGIDHLLIDEAQDTSPEQWEILQWLASDFFAGEGVAGAKVRTIFAVGDEKQSIFSFQGAKPALFERSRHHFEAAVTGAGGRFHVERLELSRRSVADVLGAVDAVFEDPARHAGLAATPGPTHHESDRADPHGRPLSGFVELWDPVVGAGAPEHRPFEAGPDGALAPVDALLADAPEAVLARRVARRVAGWIARGHHESDGRPVRAGDVMILVRRRNAFFEAVIRALKAERVPVSGADRLKLDEHVAVQDLVAAGRVALLPEDDLSLAAVLKSPLIGLDDDDLIALAPEREGSLFDALRAARSSAPRYEAAASTVERWAERAGARDPFGFYAALLGPDRGRRALLARLGPDAGDAVDAFVADLAAWCERSPPSLLGFLEEATGAGREIKRDMEDGRDEVRVMTVHAAKGLEARVVVLADTFSHPSASHDPKVFALDDSAEGAPVAAWSLKVGEDPEALSQARARERERAWDEYRRLLYVAMTRAKDRLYVVGHHGARAVNERAWYPMIEAGLAGGLTEHPDEDGEGVVRRWRANAPFERGRAPEAPPREAAPEALPDWLERPLPPEPAAAAPLRPSRLVDAAVPGRPQVADESRFARRGVLLHALLQLLPGVPAGQRVEAGLRLLSARAPGLDAGVEGGARALVEDALRVVEGAAFAPLFGPMSRAEVDVAGTLRLPGLPPRAVAGRVDRVAVLPGAVIAIDYKTGRPPRDEGFVPEPYLRQLAAYRAVLAGAYPGREARAAIVWTAAPRLVEADPARLDAALRALLAEG